MANNYPPEGEIEVYPCACGMTLCLYPGRILPCCVEKGWELELPEEGKEGGAGDV